MLEKVLGLSRYGALATITALFCATAFAAEEPTPTPRPAGGQSLSDLAKNKKLKGDQSSTGGGTIVISNDNLSDYASKGGLTTAQPGTQTQLTRGVHAGRNVRVVDPEAAAANEKMTRWRQAYTRQLELIASLERQIADLDYEIPGLWNDFYSRDDPAYRDGVIKPRLDRALLRRDEVARQLEEERPKLQQIKEDARKDGAEPGWFRGIQEPTPVPRAQPGNEGALEITDRSSVKP
jgi:hypothetical protein